MDCSIVRPLIAVLLLAWPGVARAEGLAGVMNRADGEVQLLRVSTGAAVDADGGESLYQGDKVETGEGKAEIRFVDDARMTVHPDSELLIESYLYNPSAGIGQSSITLTRGALRAVTGAIGKTHRDQYSVHTPVADIGVRGTIFDAILIAGLTVAVEQGAALMSNLGGTLLIPAGKMGFAPDRFTAPRLTSFRPAIPGENRPDDSRGQRIQQQIQQQLQQQVRPPPGPPDQHFNPPPQFPPGGNYH